MEKKPSTPLASNETARSGGLWRLCRMLLFFVAAFATLVALFYAEEDFRGKMAWNNFVASRTAQGEKTDFDIHALVPAPVPDAQNFGATPFWRYVFSLTPATGVKYGGPTNEYFQASRVSDRFEFDRDSYSGWRRARRVRLESYATSRGRNPFQPAPESATNNALLADEILGATEPFEPVRKEFLEASSRPFSRFDVNYSPENPWSILLPHLARVKMCALVLRLRCASDLALGRVDAAFEDLELTLRLADALESERFIISGLVRNVVLEIAMQTVWEGIEARQWSPAQLEKLQARLGQVKLLRGADLSLQSEVAAANQTMDLARRRPKLIEGLLDIRSNGQGSSIDMPGVYQAIPSGWLYLEQLNYNRRMIKARRSAIDPVRSVVMPDAIEAAEKGVSETGAGVGDRIWRHEVLTSMMFPSLPGFFRKMAAGQAGANEAVIACALERYHQAKGDYPESLAALSPGLIKEIPRDVVGGEPLRYRRKNSGSYDLYSIGWNQKDDNGTVGLTPKGKDVDLAKGDWVWSVPDLHLE
jgi:hypothetical protein